MSDKFLTGLVLDAPDSDTNDAFVSDKFLTGLVLDVPDSDTNDAFVSDMFLTSFKIGVGGKYGSTDAFNACVCD